MLRPRLLFPSLLLSAALCGTAFPQSSSAPMTSDEERVTLHHSAEWLNLSEHLPSPDTATAAQLETAADVLRARRFPEDALDYYGYAMARGGNVSELLNKMGVVRMELRQFDLAREMFNRVVRVQKTDAQAWNNLGATEFLRKHYSQATADYHKAISLDKRSAIFRANLGLLYFETDSFEDARSEFAKAVALDPEVMERHDDGGESAHILASGDYPRLCYEFARLYAARGSVTNMRLWLAKASEAGYDVEGALRDDAVMRSYVKDPEVEMILANSKKLREKKMAETKHLPSLGTASTDMN
jgi:Flp pilus assembly protein TadD